MMPQRNGSEGYVPSELFAVVPTYRGPVPADQLGFTLAHEHVFVSDTELDVNSPDPVWTRERKLQRAHEVLSSLESCGVNTVVDLTVFGLGRDPHLVAELASGTSVNIVAATGFYAAESLPPFFRHHGPGKLIEGPDPISELMIRELTSGIAGTDVRAAIIKVFSETQELTDDTERVFRAAAAAHNETGAPINTHSSVSVQNGLAQQDVLEALGVDLTRVVIGHAGDSLDRAYLEAILQRGSFIGFDRFGMAHAGNDEDRLNVLLSLIEAGYEKQLLVSHDAAIYSRITPPEWRAEHTPEWEMTHIPMRIVPALQSAGASRETLEQIFIRNPARLLGSVALA